MQGEVKIQIIDSKSGVVKREITAHNTVTKAAENILNEQVFRNIVNKPVDWRTAEAIIVNLFGSVMLFDTTLKSGEIFPSPEEALHMIGNAGTFQTSAIYDEHTGRFVNASVDENSVTFTWVFDEDVCIGDIAAIALTNSLAGYMGCNGLTMNLTQFGTSLVGKGTDIHKMDTTTLFRLFELASQYYTGDGLFIKTDNSIIKINTPSSGVSADKYITDISKYKDKKLWMNASLNNIVYGRLPFETEEIIADQNYKNITGALCDCAIQAYCSMTQSGGYTVYWLNVRKWTADGYTDNMYPLANLVTSVINKYTALGIADEYIPSEPADILASLNSAIDADLLFTHEGKLIWVLGQFDSGADNNYTAIAIMDLDNYGMYEIIEVDNADERYYDMLDGSLIGLLRDKRQSINTLFTTAEIEDNLYLESNGLYFYVNIGENTRIDKHIYGRPQLYCKNGKSMFKRCWVDQYSAAPYYVVAGETRYIQGTNHFGDLYSCGVLRTNYLATIQNLDKPVAKSASEQFKLVYKLTR